MEQSTFVIDIDGTICVAPKNENDSYDYANAKPISKVIEKIIALKEAGHTIILHTARGMRTHSGNVEQIKSQVLPILTEWLSANGVPYDELHVGKPWGPNVYYIDDRGLSPYQFAYFNNFENLIQENTLTL
jgi:capsule biosynthesis phosphatase